jgi:hypothetical protein
MCEGTGAPLGLEIAGANVNDFRLFRSTPSPRHRPRRRVTIASGAPSPVPWAPRPTYMNCCAPTGYGAVFGAKTAERDARRYRRKGLTGSARWLLRSLVADGVDGASVLEVGGGVGCLQIEVLEAGAVHAANVEIIDSYETTASSLIAEHDLHGRVARRVGDFARHPDLAPVADIVIMHRVICCYPDPDALMTAACAHAHERVAITIPREGLWVKISFWGMNAWLRLRRIAFRGYVHPPDQMIDVANTHGFRATRRDRGLLWESLILQRDAARPARERAEA